MQHACRQLAAQQHPAPVPACFEARLQHLLQTSHDTSATLPLAHRYLQALRDIVLEWRSPDGASGHAIWRSAPLLAEAAIERRHGEHWLCWAYAPTLLAALQDPGHWARSGLDLLARLGSHSALALYRICAAHRHDPSGRTSLQPVQWWVDALSPMAPGTTRRVWRQFKNERVLAAMAEINRETDLAVRLVEHRRGRAVVQAQFAVGTQVAGSGLMDGWAGAAAAELPPVDASLVLRAEALGLAEHRLDALLTEFGDAAVGAQLDLLAAHRHQGRLPAGPPRVATLRALLRNAAASDSPADTPP